MASNTVSLVVATVSWLDRIVWNLTAFDTLIQLILNIVLLVVCLRIRLFWATLMSICTFVIYVALQLAIYNILFSSVMPPNLITKITGLTYVVQGSSVLAAFLISWLLKWRSWGFSFISLPPHDFSAKENYFSPENEKLVIGIVMGVICLSFSLYNLINELQIFVLPTSIIVIIVLFYAMRQASKAKRSKTEPKE